MARDFLYMFGDVEPFLKIFGGEIVEQVKSIQGEIRENDLNGGSMTRNKHTSGDDELADTDVTAREGEKIPEEDEILPKAIKQILADWGNDLKDVEEQSNTLNTEPRNEAVDNKENIDIIFARDDFVLEEILPNEDYHIEATKVTRQKQIYVCNLCSYTSKSKGNLREHKTTHMNLTYSCDKCMFKGRDERYFKRHQLLHIAGRASCDECDYTAVSQQIVNNHKLTRHRGFRNRCDLCDYTSIYKISMKDHIRGVHQEIKYQCDQCDYSTISGSSLKNHMKNKHLGVRYPCKFCEFLASTKCSVKRHTATKHQDLMENDSMEHK
jgi:hypothetical protein